MSWWPPSEPARSWIRVGIGVWVRIAATTPVNLCERLRSGSTDLDVAVVQCGGQCVNRLRAADATDGPHCLFADFLIRVAQGSDEWINRLFGADTSQRPSGLATDVGVAVFECVGERSDRCGRNGLCVGTRTDEG